MSGNGATYCNRIELHKLIAQKALLPNQLEERSLMKVIKKKINNKNMEDILFTFKEGK